MIVLPDRLRAQYTAPDTTTTHTIDILSDEQPIKMDVQTLKSIPIELQQKNFFFCLLVLACGDSGGVQPMKNLLLTLATSRNDAAVLLFEVARQVYFEKKQFYLGMGGNVEEKISFDTFRTFIKDIGLIRNFTIDLPQCYHCVMDGGHPSQRFGFDFTLCARHHYVQSLEAYIDNSVDTSFGRLANLQTLTLECIDGFAPLAVSLINLVAQNSKLLQRVIVKFQFSGSTDKLHPLYEHYQALITAIEANLDVPKGSRKKAPGPFEGIWVWDVKSGVGSGLELAVSGGENERSIEN